MQTVRIMALLVALAACSHPGVGARNASEATPASRAAAALPAPVASRHAVSFLYLGLDGPAPDLPQAARDILFAARDAGQVSLRLVSTARNARLGLSVSCDGRARFLRETAGSAERHGVPWAPAGQTARTDLPPGERLRQRLELGAETTECRLQVRPAGRPGHALTLRREDLARPVLDRIERPPAPCAPAAVDPTDRLAGVFHAARPLSQTCPRPVGRTTFLADGPSALNARIEALTGARLPPALLNSGDPHVPLDWSNAPDLELIQIAYLNINADFTGFVLARMLAFHAARGTLVRIIVPDRMMTRHERQLFEGLAARYPTVQLQPFSVPPNVGPGFEAHIGRFHRMNHVKLFATLAREPGRSVAMLGGRNWHDGYIFGEPPDLSDWPFLQQYRPGALRIAGGFSSYVDFELALHDEAMVRDVIGHVSGYWHRDHDSQQLWPGQPGGRMQAAAPRPQTGQGLMRHFLSVPYADGVAQEALFVQLIDAARSRIDIASPYLNLTPALEAAFRRARDRGVAVRVVTTVRVREATDIFVTTLNRGFAIDHADWLEFTDFDPYPRLLHSKLMVFDGRLALVTSTNLNQRSFLHDTENGVLILDPPLARRIGAVIAAYVDEGERMTEDQPINALMRTLLRWPILSRGF